MSVFADEDNVFKASIHGAALMLSVLLCAYNTTVAKSARGQPWHTMSAAVYGGLMAFEVVQIGRHLGAPTRGQCAD